MPGFGDLQWWGQSEWSWPRMGSLSWEPIQLEEEICSYIIILSLRIYKGILCEFFWVKGLPELLQWGWSVKKSCTLNLLETNSRNFRLYGHYPCEEMISWPPWSWQSSCLCTTNTILLNQCYWLWWWPTFWSLPSTCLLCLFPPSSSCASPITQSHQEFSSPGSSLEWKLCVSLSVGTLSGFLSLHCTSDFICAARSSWDLRAGGSDHLLWTWSLCRTNSLIFLLELPFYSSASSCSVLVHLD